MTLSERSLKILAHSALNRISLYVLLLYGLHFKFGEVDKYFRKVDSNCFFDFKNLPSSVCKEANFDFLFPVVKRSFVRHSTSSIFSFMNFILCILWHSVASGVTVSFNLGLFLIHFIFGLDWAVALQLKITVEPVEWLLFFGSSSFSVIFFFKSILVIARVWGT